MTRASSASGWRRACSSSAATRSSPSAGTPCCGAVARSNGTIRRRRSGAHFTKHTASHSLSAHIASNSCRVTAINVQRPHSAINVRRFQLSFSSPHRRKSPFVSEKLFCISSIRCGQSRVPWPSTGWRCCAAYHFARRHGVPRAVRANTVSNIKLTAEGHIANLLRLLNTTLDVFGDEDNISPAHWGIIEAYFVYVVVWSVGANTNAAGRAQFSEFLQELLGKHAQKMERALPRDKSVYARSCSTSCPRTRGTRFASPFRRRRRSWRRR